MFLMEQDPASLTPGHDDGSAPCPCRRPRADRLLSTVLMVPIDGRVPYRFATGLLVPREPGVYLVHDLRGVMYIGKTTDLRRRFDEHYEGQANPLLAGVIARPVGELAFSWYLVSPPEQSRLERQLIRQFDPPCNRILYTTPRARQRSAGRGRGP